MKRVAFLAAVLALVFAGQPSLAGAAARTPKPATVHTVSYDRYSLMVDGKRILLDSAEFHYWRLPSPSLWLDVLQKIKADGFNAVSIYFDWAYHSPKPGVYDFSGVRNVDELLRMAEQAGLYVIARPGPYINAETTGGGFPGWLKNVPGRARSSDPGYLAAAEDWLHHIDKIIAPHQITHGGSVLLYQVENEYEVNTDAGYMQDLENTARADGIDVPLTANNAGGFANWVSGPGAVQIPLPAATPIKPPSSPHRQPGLVHGNKLASPADAPTLAKARDAHNWRTCTGPQRQGHRAREAHSRRSGRRGSGSGRRAGLSPGSRSAANDQPKQRISICAVAQGRSRAAASSRLPGAILPGRPAPFAYWVNRISAAVVAAPAVPGPGLAGRPGGEVEETVSSDIVRRRAEIGGVITGRTLCDELRRVAETAGDACAYSDEAVTGADAGAGAGWQSLTWSQARQRVLEAAAGFAALGLAPGERVVLMLPNRSEHVLADLGAVHAGALGVTLFATLAPEQIAYVAGDCDARIAVLDGAAELARWRPIVEQLPGISKIIVRDQAACPAGDRYITWADFAALGRERFAAEPGEITARMAAIKPDDPLALLYTSGTTGNPKGVLLTHRNILYAMVADEAAGLVVPRVRWVSYLPLAHIAERMLSIYLPIRAAGHVHFCPDSARLVQMLGKVRPTAFFGVPRVWEKVRAGIQALLTAEQDEGKRAAVQQAMETGRRFVESCQYGHTTSPELAAQFRAADEQVLRPIRSLLGLGEASPVSSAAAPLPPDVAAFFAGLGMKILDVYGMTETTGAFTANTPTEFKLGTVGRPIAGMEVRIADDGEILVRGPLTTPGYLNRPDLTGALIGAEGWLRTGDIGTIDADGFVSVTDRKKELIITAGGENIAPAAVENALVAHPLIGQALAYGDRRPYVAALLTLDGEAATAWARARGLAAGSLAALASDPQVLAEVAAGVAAANDQLTRAEQVKRWRLLPVEWTAQTGELTPTLKLKRRVVHAKYADVIDSLYPR